jgi:uncharacterized protein YjiS (DUF1127 family)
MTVPFSVGGSHAALARPASQGRVAAWLGVLRASGASCLGLLRECQRRHCSRMYIWQLDDYQLKDIGLSRAEAEWEANKPFWMA